jgi:hypothetical protein
VGDCVAVRRCEEAGNSQDTRLLTDQWVTLDDVDRSATVRRCRVDTEC